MYQPNAITSSPATPLTEATTALAHATQFHRLRCELDALDRRIADLETVAEPHLLRYLDLVTLPPAQRTPAYAEELTWLDRRMPQLENEIGDLKARRRWLVREILRLQRGEGGLL